MSTNRECSRSGSSRFRPNRADAMLVTLIALVSLVWLPANATTAGEAALRNSPPPHQKPGTGRGSVKADWVRLQGWVEGKTGHVAMLDELKAQVQRCVEAPLGGKSRPPRFWPDYVESIQRDTYDAANRRITYSTTLVYAVNPADCSLMEIRGAIARLESAIGQCDIDFIHKTARGYCGDGAGSNAPLARRTQAPVGVPAGRVGAVHATSREALAAMDNAMKQFGPTKTGERKTIAGIDCDVETNGLFGTTCIWRGDTLAGRQNGSGVRSANMELEVTNVGGVSAHAVLAQANAMVDAAVFAPHRADGFQITSRRPK